MAPPHQLAYHDELDDTNFRLLEVNIPADEDEADRKPISCMLTTFPLLKRPNYNCLSYAWDEPLAARGTIDRSILINGEEVPVQANLAYALRYYIGLVRSGIAVDHKPTWFWIDALCINQSNIAERSLQVSIMDRIYRDAVKVLVWLGPDPDNEAYTVNQFLRAVLQQYFHDGKKNNYNDNFLFLSQAGPDLPEYSADIWKLTVRFWDRAWFRRVWVQQEVALAREADFWCGRVMFTLDELIKISHFFVISGLGWTLIPVRNNINDRSFEGFAIGNGPLHIQGLRDMLFRKYMSEHDTQRRLADRVMGSLPGEDGAAPSRTIIRIFACQLSLSFTNRATDDRDRIYALLPVMKQIALAYGFEELPLAVNYNKQVAEVYQEVTSWIIGQSDWLGIFALVNQRRTLADCQAKSMPSWVVDFSSTEPAGPTALRYRGHYHDRLVKSRALLNEQNRPVIKRAALEVSVQRIGTVVDVGNSYNEEIDDGDFEATAKLLLKCPPVVHSSGRTRIDWWIDTLLGRESTQPCSAETRTTFAQLMQSVILRRLQRDARDGISNDAADFFKHQRSVIRLAEEDDTDTVPKDAEWRKTFWDPERVAKIRAYPFDAFGPRLEVQGRRLLRLGDLCIPHCATSMLLAIGPQTTEVGDTICLVAGSTMPLVLRPATDADESSEPIVTQQVRLVGEAYVNGAGEPVDMFEGEDWQNVRII